MHEVVDFSIPYKCTLSRMKDGFKSLQTKLLSANANIGCFFKTSTCRTFH